LVAPGAGDHLAARALLLSVITDAGYSFVAEYCVDMGASAVIANSQGEAISVRLPGDAVIVLETGTNFDHEQYSVDDFKFRPAGVIVSRNDRTFDLQDSVDVFEFGQSELGLLGKRPVNRDPGPGQIPYIIHVP